MKTKKKMDPVEKAIRAAVAGGFVLQHDRYITGDLETPCGCAMSAFAHQKHIDRETKWWTAISAAGALGKLTKVSTTLLAGIEEGFEGTDFSWNEDLRHGRYKEGVAIGRRLTKLAIPKEVE